MSTDTVQHLWEIKHSYYCERQNFFSNETVFYFDSPDEIIAEEASSNPDLNMLFRWDWNWGTDTSPVGLTDEEQSVLERTPPDDVYSRTGLLYLFFMQQRKGIYRCLIIKVCRADEPVIREFLQARWEYMRKLWEPLSAPQNIVETKILSQELECSMLQQTMLNQLFTSEQSMNVMSARLCRVKKFYTAAVLIAFALGMFAGWAFT